MNACLTIRLLTLLLSLSSGCHGQGNQPEREATGKEIVGGPFENRELMYIGMPEPINAVDTSAGWHQTGQKLLITGTIYQPDGKTPAPDVVLYYYHTDVHGYYASQEGLDKRVARHGYIRGWVKSDAQGRYAIYTVRPAPYPNNTMPAHIHPAIQEPDIEDAYYIDEFVFDDDVLLTSAKRQALENRGGSGVLRLVESGNLQIAEHDIILGLNIPHYPITVPPRIESGRRVGEDVLSFTPYHAWGPDKGSRTCPICRYGRHHGILYFVGNAPNWTDIRKWLRYLERESRQRGKYLKGYFIYGNDHAYNPKDRTTTLENLGKTLGLAHTALTLVPSFSDQVSDVYLNRINPTVESTLLLYRNRTIIDKFINLPPSPDNFDIISKRLDATRSEFADFPEPHPQ
ncbi:MAG: intradiol ring-cleavage dioxygenase [Cyclobacteriaceae bacterium]